MKTQGHLLKMKTNHASPVEYSLSLDNELTPLNQFLGKKIEMNFLDEIQCIATGEKIKKSYSQGYSYKAFITLPECDLCIVKPELCHFAKGTCRDPEWGKQHCFQPHYLYLAYSSGLKVGITRQKQVPTRFMDQGAHYALPILQFKSRFDSGVMEAELKGEFNDKTNWQQMLKGGADESFNPEDLFAIRDEIYENYGDTIDQLEAEDLDHDLIEINYPVLSYPEKIKSLGFDKQKTVAGTLQGLKGQYMILDTGVINMRKHQGYLIEFSASV